MPEGTATSPLPAARPFSKPAGTAASRVQHCCHWAVEAAPKRLSEAERTLIGQHADSLDIKPVVAAASALDAMEDVHVTAG